jgi:hypothetical protein
MSIYLPVVLPRLQLDLAGPLLCRPARGDIIAPCVTDETIQMDTFTFLSSYFGTYSKNFSNLQPNTNILVLSALFCAAGLQLWRDFDLIRNFKQYLVSSAKSSNHSDEIRELPGRLIGQTGPRESRFCQRFKNTQMSAPVRDLHSSSYRGACTAPPPKKKNQRMRNQTSWLLKKTRNLQRLYPK